MCMREAFNPQKHHEQLLCTDGEEGILKHTHTHTYCDTVLRGRQMLGPFSNTLEDHAKHKVGELGNIPLFPTSQGPLEWCHQLINEHKALSFSSSPSPSPTEVCIVWGVEMCPVCFAPSV